MEEVQKPTRSKSVEEPKMEVTKTKKAETAKTEPTALNTFLEHQRKAITEAGRALEGLIPVDFRKHSQAALKEVVDSYRKLFNAALDSVINTVEKARLGDKAQTKK